MASSRISKLFTKANDIAKEVGQEYKKVKEQYQQQQQQQQGYNNQYDTSQPQTNSWQTYQASGYPPPPTGTTQHQPVYQGYQSPVPQSPVGYQQQHQSYQQYATRPQSYQYIPPPPPHPPQPPQEFGYTAAPPVSHIPRVDHQAQIESDRQAAETLAAQFKAEDDKLKEAEQELERLRIQDEAAKAQAKAQARLSKPANARYEVPQAGAPPAQGTASYAHPPPPPPPQSQNQHRYTYQHNPEAPAVPTPTSSSYDAVPPISPATSYSGQQHFQQQQQQQQQQRQHYQNHQQQHYQNQQQQQTFQATRRESHPPRPEVHPCGIAPVTECIEDSFPLDHDWFFHPSAPTFLICSRCYVDHIYETRFRTSFTQIHFPADKKRKCLFGTRRMKNALWPMAVYSHRLNDVIDFMKRREDILPCPESICIPGTDWYTTPNIPDAAFCPACFEDLLMSSSFGSHFNLTLDRRHNCHGDLIYVKRMLDGCAETNDWPGFATEVQERLQFSPCEGPSPVPSRSRQWFESTRGPRGMQICAACYYDYFRHTSDQKFWKQTVPREYESVCLFGSVNVLFTIGRAFIKKDYSIFWKAMDQWSKYPACGAPGSTWFVLPNRAKDFIVCGACYSTLVYAYGGSSWFTPNPSSVPSRDPHVCVFNVDNPQCETNFIALYESVLRGTWKPLIDQAAALADISPYSRNDAANQRW